MVIESIVHAERDADVSSPSRHFSSCRFFCYLHLQQPLAEARQELGEGPFVSLCAGGENGNRVCGCDVSCCEPYTQASMEPWLHAACYSACVSGCIICCTTRSILIMGLK